MPSKRVIFVLLFIFAEVFTFAVFRYWAVSRNIDKTGENPKQSAQNANPPADGSKILIEKVGRLILLPQNELPSIAAINNAVQLQKDSLFYKDAPNELSAMITGNPSDHLFLEHYDEDSLAIILKHFVEQVVVEKNRRGKLIVIDGGDGSGKTTQSALLISYFSSHGLSVKGFDFPRYYSSFHGKFAGRFLAGEFGNNVSPYLASLAYALDRASAKEEMDQFLSHGGIIVSNRYATSNMAHQGARLAEDKREEFLDWIDELEYKIHKIPREDVVIYLHVPWVVGMELSKKKGERAYLGDKQDILEADQKHRQEAETMYLSLAKKRKNRLVIECVEDGAMLPKDKIHEKILTVLRQRKLLINEGKPL